jgi:hypothetical protein
LLVRTNPAVELLSSVAVVAENLIPALSAFNLPFDGPKAPKTAPILSPILRAVIVGVVNG